MFSLTIVFGSPAVPWTLLFNSKEAADAAFENYKSSKTTSFNGENFMQKDDFEQDVCIARTSLHGAMLEDMDKSKLAAIERGLHQHKTHIAAQKRGQQDPEIQAYARMQQMGGGGPAVLQPGGFNGAFRQ